MDDNVIFISPDDIEMLAISEYSEDLTAHFSQIPEVAKPLFRGQRLHSQSLKQCFMRHRRW